MAGAVVKRLEPTEKFSKGKMIACVAIAAFMVMMLARPDYYLASARKGLALYATSVLPSLFPFYFCSLMLTNMGAARTVSKLLGKPVSKLYGTPEESAYVLLLSMLSGYPVGASMTAELFEAGVFSKDEAKAVAAFASTSGPIFMLGTVGSAIFHDIRVGAVILASHYIAALVNGFIFRIRKSRKTTPLESEKINSTADLATHTIIQSDVDNILSKTISNSTLSMLYVGGYIVLCGMLIDTLPLMRLDILLESALGSDAGRTVFAMLCSVIEMTRGCIMGAEVTCLPLAVGMCAGMISLGGLSVTLQNYTFLSRTGMKASEILLRKFCHALIAAGLGAAFSLLL